LKYKIVIPKKNKNTKDKSKSAQMVEEKYSLGTAPNQKHLDTYIIFFFEETHT